MQYACSVYLQNQIAIKRERKDSTSAVLLEANKSDNTNSDENERCNRVRIVL